MPHRLESNAYVCLGSTVVVLCMDSCLVEFISNHNMKLIENSRNLLNVSIGMKRFDNRGNRVAMADDQYGSGCRTLLNLGDNLFDSICWNDNWA